MTEMAHPFDSDDPGRRLDYLTGRHDEREYGQSAAYQRGWADAMDAWRRRIARESAHLRRATQIVHALARRPVVVPEVLWGSPEEMTAELAEREQLRAEAFRAACRETRGRLRLPSASGVAS
ncbi:MAG: hypothetical protein IPJ15_05945 [Actinomycetales bacterium]|nr:hypothetical protein [Candidatus Phosphoribacter baldrii]HRC18877.1 hypothetical protein [Phycicoccus elongatus]